MSLLKKRPTRATNVTPGLREKVRDLSPRGTMRLTVDVEAEDYRRLKIRAAELGSDIATIVRDLVMIPNTLGAEEWRDLQDGAIAAGHSLGAHITALLRNSVSATSRKHDATTPRRAAKAPETRP